MATEVRYAVAPIQKVDVRDPSGTDDNTWTMSGYAAVFDQTTTLYNGKFLRLEESISPDAFDRVLREQGMDQPSGVVHFNFGHDMNSAVAATDVAAGQPGSLALRADNTGLFFLAKVSRDDPDGVKLAAKMRSGVVKQASFAFTIRAAEYKTTEAEDGPDVEHRTILDLEHLYDVCACPQGAYSSTVSGLRSYAAAIGQLEREATHVNPAWMFAANGTSSSGGVITVTPQVGSGESPTPQNDAVLAYRMRRLHRQKDRFNG